MYVQDHKVLSNRTLLALCKISMWLRWKTMQRKHFLDCLKHWVLSLMPEINYTCFFIYIFHSICNLTLLKYIKKCMNKKPINRRTKETDFILFLDIFFYFGFVIGWAYFKKLNYYNIMFVLSELFLCNKCCEKCNWLLNMNEIITQWFE